MFLTRPIVALFATLLLVPLASAQETAPKFTVGDAHIIPVLGKKTYYVNDSVFPFLPDANGTGRLAFWGDAIVMRYTGPDIDHLTPPDGSQVVQVTPAEGVNPDWHRNGTWMLTATRLADGTLVGFVHGEDHVFADGKKGGEWNSTGVWTSSDDGLTWVDHGEVVGSKKPDVHQTAGMAMNECIWDTANKRWIGYNGPYAFSSSDPHALPGTWSGYHNGSFSVPIDVTAPMPPLTPAPGLEHSGVNWGGLSYNSYLKQFIRTWCYGRTVKIAFSPDGVTWNHISTLYEEKDPATAQANFSYASLIGDTNTSSGQDCTLVYMYYPGPNTKTVSGHVKDMIRRPVHFEL